MFKRLKGLDYRYLESSSDKLLVRFEANKLKEITSKQLSSFKLEVIKNSKLGYSSSSDKDEQFLVSKALESAQFGDKVDYSYPKKVLLPKIKLYSKKVEKLSFDDFIKIGEDITLEITKFDKEILVSVYLVKEENSFKLINSNHFNQTQKQTSVEIYTEGQLVKSGDILSIDNHYSWSDLAFDKKDFIEKIIEKFKYSKNVSKINSDKYQVIFTPNGLSSLISFLETALSGESVYKKVSVWSNSLGRQVCDKRFSLIDDPLIDYAISSASFDDEGNVSRKLSLIECGILENFYLDLKNASRLNLAPNSRGFGLPANPGVTNLIIEPGEKSSKEIIKSIKNGVLIDQVIGGGQDSPYSGDFSLNIHLGFLINNGEIVGRIKNALVSGNVFDMLKVSIEQISRDRQWIGGSAYFPFISFNNITVSAG